MTKKQSCLLLFQITVHVYAKVISLIFMMIHNKNVWYLCGKIVYIASIMIESVIWINFKNNIIVLKSMYEM